MFFRLSVCSHTSKNTFQISRNFLYMLFKAVARSSSDDNAISYELPVLWMTSRFHIRAQWLGASDHRRATRHPLPEPYRLAHSRQQTIWLGDAAGLCTVCIIRLILYAPLIRLRRMALYKCVFDLIWFDFKSF